MYCKTELHREEDDSLVIVRRLLPEDITVELLEHRDGIISYHTSDIVPIPPVKGWKAYCSFIINAQLICHQFRNEFIRVWVSECTFELIVPIPRFFSASTTIPRMPEAQSLWFYVRDLLRRLVSFARREVRSIRLKWELPISHSRQTLYDCQKYLQNLNGLEGRDVCSLFERLDDVHADLEIELELSLKRVGDTESGVRRIFTLHQQTPDIARTTGAPDWISRDGPILVKAPRINLVHGLAWQVMQYSLDALPHQSGLLF